MKLMIRFGLFVLACSILFSACRNETTIQQGAILSESFILEQPDTLFLTSDTLSQPALTISGEDLVLDFGGLTILGTDTPAQPDQFSGLAIEVKEGKNITIKNLNIHGFKIALLASEIEHLTLDSCNFSYNYRQRLKSTREKEDLSDWLYFHQNDQDEWLRYGAGVYLRSCDSATVKNCTITEGMNGLLMTRCNNGLFWNNNFHFNSGLGIGMYRSSHNRVMHNRLDWNVRGYSHGIYARGQDSAGILCYEQSNDNIFAYNSATHSGDGFFLWAGHTTMDTGEGGCNNNLIYGNDFSHAPANGIEVTFSSNEIGNNQLEDCRYGIWGGYSWETTITNNYIGDCEVGIAIEHGQDNTISRNTFYKDSVGIKLWERDKQPEDWGYAQHKDVSSRGYLISRNWFQRVSTPLEVYNTKDLEHKSPMYAKDDDPESIWGIGASTKAPPLPGGHETLLPTGHPRGRQFILVNEWGPYSFRYPSVWLREIEGDRYNFLLLGPKQGNWKIVGGEGFEGVNQKTGTFPMTIIATKAPEAEAVSIELEFIGEACVDQFGRRYGKGAGVRFGYGDR